MNAIVIFNSVRIAAQPESMHVVHYSLSKYTYECMDGFATESGANPDTFLILIASNNHLHFYRIERRESEKIKTVRLD